MADNIAKTGRWVRLSDLIQSRMLSSIVATLLLVAVWFATGSFEAVGRLFQFLILPLACIWFADVMGRLTVIQLGMFPRPISQPTPPIAVAIGGWILIFAVVFVVAIQIW